MRPILPGPPESPADVELFRQKVLSERTVRDNLVLADGSGALVLLRLSAAIEVREDIQAQILSRLEGLARKYEGPEKIHISGNAAFLVYVNRYMRQDLAFLLPVVVAVVVLVLFLSFRSVWGVVLPLGVVLVGLIWTMGLVGLTGHKLTMISTFLPVVLVAVGSAYGIHVVNEYLQRIARGEGKKEAAGHDRRDVCARPGRGRDHRRRLPHPAFLLPRAHPGVRALLSLRGHDLLPFGHGHDPRAFPAFAQA